MKNINESFREAPEKYWDIPDLTAKIPSFRKAPFQESRSEGLTALLIKGFRGDPLPDPASEGGEKNYTRLSANTATPEKLSTRKEGEFFAYYGIPSTPPPPGGYPGIVLIHGGGGTAFPIYTKRWIKKGYAVIALDWYNQRPILKEHTKNVIIDRKPLTDSAIQDHVCNVANMVLAHSFLRAQKEVNEERTAFVGLSWGSWYGAMLAAVDPRFKGGVEIYCGDVKPESSKFINGRFHHAGRIPLYWIASTNDQNMTLETLKNAFAEYPELENKTIVNNLPHGHVGFDFAACFRMAAYFTGSQPTLPKLGAIQQEGQKISAKILHPGKGIRFALLCYTDSRREVYHEREWKSIPAEIRGDTISALLPEGAHQFYLTACEKESKYHDLCGSTEPVILPMPEKLKNL